MTEAVLVSSLGMWVSVVAIMTIGVAGGALLYVCEKIAAKHRPTH